MFLERLVPVLTDLLAAAHASGEVVADIGSYELVRAVGDLVARRWNTPPPVRPGLWGSGASRPIG